MSNNEKKYTNTKLNISSSLAELRSQLKSKIFRKMRYGMKRQIPIKNRNMQYWIPARFLINPMSGVPFQSNKARNSDGMKNSIRTARSAIHPRFFFFHRFRKISPSNTSSVFVSRFNENSIHDDSSWLTPVAAAPRSIYEDYTPLIATYDPPARGREAIRRVTCFATGPRSRFSFDETDSS